MNHQLIEKIIKTHHKTCPPMIYDNPLLDREVATALSKSFVKILNFSGQRNINNSLRTSVLCSIRKLCQLEPENHLKLTENVSSLLTDLYNKIVHESLKTSTDKDLDEFLIMILNDLHLNSKYEYSPNPEILQSLLNLNETNVLNNLSKNILHLDISSKNLVLLQSLWNNESVNVTNFDDISVKITAKIEHTLLEASHKVIAENSYEIVFDMDSLSDLIKKCAKSSKCFQICCNILNYLLLETNFNGKIQQFIILFICNVKIYCSETISVLYPSHLAHIVLLMDIDIKTLTEFLNKELVEKVLNLLNNLRIVSKNDVIMLLSHYPDWFDLFASQ